MRLLPNGEGATHYIQTHINLEGYSSELVEHTIRDQLNEIMRPDADFTRITVQKNLETKVWEIHLEEGPGNRIRLSERGSGLKTVLLVLINLLIVPRLSHRTAADYVFAFEELENNLHPALQKRLFRYIRKFMVENGSTVLLTTHSHVVVDLFSRDPEAQIIHVVHDGTKATATPVSGFLNHRNIFADLDVRASDLLQTNAIVWVEGPSDRIYFNRWIDLWSNGELKEHVDYECVTYGGSILANYGFSTDDELAEEIEDGDKANLGLVQAIRINPNAIVLMDSDRRMVSSEVKRHTARINAEVLAINGYPWVTQGREVENYIPWDALKSLLKASDAQMPDPYEDVFDFIKKNRGLTWRKRKSELAKRVCESLTKKMIEGHLDLAQRLTDVCQKIRDWNRFRPSRPLDQSDSLVVSDQP